MEAVRVANTLQKEMLMDYGERFGKSKAGTYVIRRLVDVAASTNNRFVRFFVMTLVRGLGVDVCFHDNYVHRNH